MRQIRIGEGISSPNSGYFWGPYLPVNVTMPYSRSTVQKIFQEIAFKRLFCSSVFSSAGYAPHLIQTLSKRAFYRFDHFRCLTSPLGFPDDLILEYVCSSQNPNMTAVRVHSQVSESRVVITVLSKFFHRAEQEYLI